MNIMILTERTDDVLSKMSNFYKMNYTGQSIISVGFEGDTESALTEFFDLDCHRNPNHHLVIVADDIRRLWQGMRELLDVVIEMQTEEVEDWFIGLLDSTFTQ